MEASDSIEAQKGELRRKMVRLREEARPFEARAAGEAIASALLASPEWAGAQAVGLFAGLEDEPDTRPIFAALLAAGKRAFFPRCRAGGDLDMIRVDDWSELRAGRFGILEPPQGASASPLSELDLLLLPGVAFDPCGRRLGRGGGFYDRTLAMGAVPRLIGVAYAFQVIDRVPTREHDRWVHAIVDENGLRPAADPIA
ncbi:MAG: 5-formyltetrahydrofolate cyclo-ligase [Myxococcota bacterium]|nr:5-formyltetrahydrofolate cyclo-ligase [Myxococcota bacterium]